MSRSPRKQFANALYHVTSRGNRGAVIYRTDDDFLRWQDILGATVDKYDFLVHSYCQMPNHFHLLVETPQANLAAGMAYLNGQYCQKFNWRHELTGHVIQGRYYALPIEREAHLLEASRYISLNPVRARLAAHPVAWRWSSYAAFAGKVNPPAWLHAEWMLSQFGKGDLASRRLAYAEFVLQGIGLGDPLADLLPRPTTNIALPSSMDAEQRHLHLPGRNEAIRHAFVSGGHSVSAIARHFGISPRAVRRVIDIPPTTKK